ncbi:MAG: hypothetical protein FJ291_09220 [Planctomycetes bacterium]|nr:hypothetical protein [Planctomycetota bacterium]
MHLFPAGGAMGRRSLAATRGAWCILGVALMALSFSAAGYGAERFGVRRWVKPDGPKFLPDEVIVKFKPGAAQAAIEAVHRRHGTAEIYTSKLGGFKRVRTPAGKTIEEMVAALSKEPSVEYAEPNSICYAFMTPNDPYYQYQWHLDIPQSSENPAWHGSNGGGINVEPAWDVSQGLGVVVAVVDTGVAYENYSKPPPQPKTYYEAPDLANTTFVPGYNFIADTTHANDDDGHGTHVTGTIAQSTNNSLGVAGVAFRCSIMPVKVLNSRGSGTAATVADGIRFAADNGAKVINMSLGWPVTGGVPYDPGETVRSAVAYAYGMGVTIVCASGNDGESAVAYPAAYDDYCIAVGATRYDETRPSYSNYGASLDLVAPGGDLGVDQNGDGYADGVLQNTFGNRLDDWNYFFYQGTSMAAPHVSGVAALIIALGVTNPDEVRSILQSTAEDKGAVGWDQLYGYGLVHAYAAVQVAGAPTVAMVTVLRASPQDSGVAVTWETAAETGTLGFYVTRRDEATGEEQRVGNRLLRALAHAPLGGKYRLLDPTAEPGRTYSYTLVEVEAGGQERFHGTCRATLDKGVGGAAAATPALRPPDAERPGYSFSARETGEPRPRRAGRGGACPRPDLGAHKGRPYRWASPGAAAVKIGVKEDGLYFVGSSDIAPLLGIPEEGMGNLIQHGLLALSCQGRPVAYLPADDAGGICFYGKKLDSIYTDENIYWVELGRGILVRQLSQSESVPAAGTETFVDSAHAEENYFPATGLYHDPEADFWLWAYLMAGSPGDDRRSFIIRADGAASAGLATLKVRLKGATDTKGAPDHHARVALNGTMVGEGRWDGTEARTLEFAFRQGLLLEGANTVSVEAALPPGTPYSVFYVDSFDLTYQRHYVAVGDSLLLRADQNPVVTVTGFNSPAISVFDVTDPWSPALLRGTTIDEADGTCRVSFAAAGPDDLYLALTPGAVRSPASLRPDVPSRLKSRANAAAYLAIAPSELKEGAKALADYRQAQGLAALVVDIEDVYDEFAYGIATPKAVQAFLAWARSNWREPPRYVLLAGHGTWDYKDYLGRGDNLIPALQVDTPYGLFSHDGEFSKQAAVGRLPARTPDELAVMIAKTIAYEQSVGAWRNRVLMVADNADGGGNFPRDSDDLAALIPAGHAVDKVYLSQFSLNEARRRLISGLDAGALLVNYIGHGGMAQWTHEGLLRTSDVDALRNGTRLPVVAALTCLSARFALPGYDCIGEAFVLKPDGGAVAFWGPSGLSMNDEAKGLGRRFIQAAFGQPAARVGDAALRAAATETEMSKTFNLLGDPALKLRPAD